MVSFLQPSELAATISSLNRGTILQASLSSVILIDVRPFTIYSEAHIMGAINVKCSISEKADSKETAVKNLHHVEDQLSMKAKEIFKDRKGKIVHVYDHSATASKLITGIINSAVNC